jgi:carbon monoxide dehydrogenase subunit G
VEQSGEYRIAASREVVWTALNDPDVLAACLTGCQSMTRTADDHFDAVVKAKVGPVSATFTADLEITDINELSSYRINAGVKGGAAGFGKGSAEVVLTEDGEATILRYEATASVGGKLAQVGSRLIDGAASKMAKDFFGAFSEHVAPQTTQPIEEAETPDGVETSGSSGQWLIWTIAFGVLILALGLAV